MALHISKILSDRKAQINLLREGIREVAASKENTGGIVKIIAAVGRDANKRPAKRFVKTPVGQRALANPDGLLHILQDRDYLAACPASSLGRAYYDFVYAENLSADGLVDAVNVGKDAAGGMALVQDPATAALSARFRDLHDLWHVTTGYGRDVMGEMNILFFSYAQIRNPGFAFISLIAAGVAKLADREIPAYRALMESYSNGRTANWLIAEDWEAMMELPLEEVRGKFGISQPKIYLSVQERAAGLEHKIQNLQTRLRGAFAA